jgi:CubicO group peptidase (beta-lactamase class C family)
MYIIVGMLLERLTGVTWEEFLRQRVLQPLGMTQTCFSLDDVSDRSAVMVDYARGGRTLVPWASQWQPRLWSAFQQAPCGPCGSIVSTIDDLCRWLQFLVGGHPNAEQIIEGEALARLWDVQIPCPSPLQAPEISDGGCGMGWFIQNYRGKRLVGHWGGGGGPTLITFMPEAGIGVVVHTNRADVPFHAINAPCLCVYDRLLRQDVLPWKERWLWFEAANQPSRPTSISSKEPANAAQFVATYVSPGYGQLEVVLRPPELLLVYQELEFLLQPENADIFTATLRSKTPRLLQDWFGSRYVTFQRARSGEIESVAVPFEPSVANIVFHRQ